MCLAIPGRILEITDPDPLTRSGRVAFGGITKTVNLSFVPTAGIGDYVVVHVGFAISALDEAAAERTLETLREVDPQAFAELGTPPENH